MRSLLSTAISLNCDDQRELFSKLPILGQVKLALELLLEDDPKGKELGEAALLDLQDLEIENLYSEAEIEGLIKSKGDAWIV